VWQGYVLRRAVQQSLNGLARLREVQTPPPVGSRLEGNRGFPGVRKAISVRSFPHRRLGVNVEGPIASHVRTSTAAVPTRRRGPVVWCSTRRQVSAGRAAPMAAWLHVCQGGITCKIGGADGSAAVKGPRFSACMRKPQRLTRFVPQAPERLEDIVMVGKTGKVGNLDMAGKSFF